jgi:hypothetical protein
MKIEITMLVRERRRNEDAVRGTMRELRTHMKGKV